MKKGSILLGLALVISVALAALQGQRLNTIRESTDFYRWIQTAATQIRLESGNSIEAAVLEQETEEEAANYMDDELFAEIAQKAESAPALQEVELSPADVDAQGKPYPRLVVAVNEVIQDRTDDVSGAALGETGGKWDDEIWSLATSREMAPQRETFLKYKRENRLVSLGQGMSFEDIYATPQTEEGQEATDIADIRRLGGAPVSMANMFFGFRKMAANLLWLQVDKYWHAGHLHRMVPLMKTTVTLDPNFVDAFLLGAWHLAYNVTAPMTDTPEPLKAYDPYHQARVGVKESYYYQGVDFLKDGIRKNPRNYKLYFDLGFSIYSLKLNDYANAVTYLSEAIRYKHDRWVPRQLAIAQQKNGQYADALAGWEAYLQKYPNNVNAPRFIETNKALLIEEEADKVAEAGDEARAKELRDIAYAKWKDIAVNQEDPYALMRWRRMDALDLARQGRYYEANGLLDQARFEVPSHFDEISELIIKIKKEGDLPLSMSEKMFLTRKAEADKYIADELKKITGRDYELRDDDVWYETGYSGEEATLLTPGSELVSKLRAQHDTLNLILSFRAPVVFQLDGTWYRFRPKAI